MKCSDYLIQVLERDRERYGDTTSDHRLKRSLIGANTEAGELVQLLYDDVDIIDLIDVLDECGDVLYNLVRALDAAGFTLDDCMHASAAKLVRRRTYGKEKQQERTMLQAMFGRGA